MNRTVIHATEKDLALLATRDLGFWRRLRVSAHLRQCALCRQTLEAYSALGEQVREEACELPAGLNWNALAREMTGNIRVGLEAGECIEHVAHPMRRHILNWNLTAALVSVAVLGLCSFWLRLPAPQAEHLRAAVKSIVLGKKPAQPAAQLLPAAAVLETSPSGPVVEENGASMKLLVPQSSEGVSVSVNLQDSVSARYVDADSGQVTISKVYYAQ